MFERRTSLSSKSSIRLLLRTAFLCIAASTHSLASDLTVRVDRAKVERGQTVAVSINADRAQEVQASLVTPTVGTRPLQLSRSADGTVSATIEIPAISPSGLFVVHAWTGDKSKPSDVGKASFRVGNIVADFSIMNYVDKERRAADLDAYLSDFRSVGGNFLIAHNLIIPSGAFYPSGIARTDVVAGGSNDLIELLLERADRQGIPVLLSVSWDMTRQSHYNARLDEIRRIATELYTLYRHHPSLAGFYSYQEGSGTYYAPYVREFSEHIKSLDRGLLTACAPHIDDPLLAGYLSTIEELDIMIYQSAVMASYRPDNRKEFPLRRVRDFSGLGAGAKRLQNKITLTHVELFAYMEKRSRPEVLTASYDDIYGQILSAATVTDTDGIALFAYHTHIFDQSKRFNEGKVGRSAVEKGLKLYETITSDISKERNPLALYIPYSDFVIERWNNYFLPALDAFRHLGVAIDILPYAPPLKESIYPYYPFHMNEDVLKRLLAERTVLVLGNVSGFQQTDSDLIKAFVEAGGVLVAFGPQIPYGRSYDRRELFGGDHSAATFHTSVSGGRVVAQFPKSELPSWRTTTASVMARYEDGSAAIVKNKFGKGTVFAILPSATFAAENLPGHVRAVLNEALRIHEKPPLLKITGTNNDFDIAFQRTEVNLSVAVVNHNSSKQVIRITNSGLPPQQCSTRIGTEKTVLLKLGDMTHQGEITIPKKEVAVVRCKIPARD